MKFTCDSCGAQYMIGDEKLGQRGVKVRCKKCSYVIILRPPGYQPSSKKPTSHRDDRGDAAGDSMHASGASESDAGAFLADAAGPTVPISQPVTVDLDELVAAKPELLPSDVAAATSSDLGLSREFAALGFDEDARKPLVAPSLNVGLDLARVTGEGFPDASSPFQLGQIGGSLEESDDVRSEDSSESDPWFQPSEPGGPGDLGGSVPNIGGPDEELFEATSVDGRSPFLRPAPPSDAQPAPFEDDSTSEATTPGDKLTLAAADLGEGPTPDAASFDDGGETKLGGARSVLSSRSMNDASPSQPRTEEVVRDRIDALENNEFADLSRELSSTMAEETSWPPRAASRARAHREKDREVVVRFGSPGAVATTLQDAHVASEPAARAIDASGENGDERPRGEEGPPRVDSEIKSAFDAMFSPMAGPLGARADAGLSGRPGGEASSQELIAGAAGYADSPDKRPTRLFDVGAMQQVQSEQDLASNGNGRRVVSISSGPREWYVAINDEQVGPLTFNDVRARWDQGEVGPNSLCWKQGMPDWIAIRFTKELESLGDMEDRARTVVARIEERREEPEEGTEVAPSIAKDGDVPSDSAPFSAPLSAPPDRTPDEPSWRPSAASALASLAAAELGGDPPSSDKRDVAVGRALPATTDALEKLLHGSKSSASAFGALEKSSSAIRPLPKRSEIASSISLSDPIAARARGTSYALPLAVFGGFVLLSVVVLTLFWWRPGSEPQIPASAVASLPPASGAREGASFSGAKTVPGGAPPSAPAGGGAPDPAQTAAPSPSGIGDAPIARGGSPREDAEVRSGEAPGVAPSSAQSESQGSAEAAGATRRAGAETDGDDAKKGAKSQKKGKSSQGSSGTSGRKSGAPPKEGAQVIAASSRQRPPDLEEDDSKPASDEDLLLPGKKRRPVLEESNEPPKQLEDSDILGVMRKHRDTIAGCLQKQKSSDPSLEGVMTVKFVIERGGRTNRWSVSPDKFEKSIVGKCVLDAVKGWAFPKFSGPPMPVDFPVRVKGR